MPQWIFAGVGEYVEIDMRSFRSVTVCAAVGVAILAACQEPEPPQLGDLQVSVSVVAAARVAEDTDGFYIAVDQGQPVHVAVVDSVFFLAIPAGVHRIDLTDIRSTCRVGPETPYNIMVQPDTLVRIRFMGSCQ